MAFRDYEGLTEAQKLILREKRRSAANMIRKAYRDTLAEGTKKIIEAGRLADQGKKVPTRITLSVLASNGEIDLRVKTAGNRRFLGIFPTKIIRSSSEVPNAINGYRKSVSKGIQSSMPEIKEMLRENTIRGL